jgi:hypothetical protein
MTILSALSAERRPQPAVRKPPLWERLRILQRMPHPLTAADPHERDRSGEEWKRQAPEILDDLFIIMGECLIGIDVRELFQTTAQRVYPRANNRPREEVRRKVVWDLYTCALSQGFSEKEARKSARAFMLRRYKKNPDTARRLTRDYIREGKAKGWPAFKG